MHDLRVVSTASPCRLGRPASHPQVSCCGDTRQSTGWPGSADDFGLDSPFPLSHHFNQVPRCYVSEIPVRGCQRCMPELLSDDRHGYTFHHQLETVRVSQPVRMHSLLDADPVGQPHQHGSHVRRFQRLPL